MKDEKLIKLIVREPERGMKKLVDTYLGLVLSVIRSKLSPNAFCSADVEDCAAETFAEFYLGAVRKGAPACSVKTALCVAAKRNALDRLRKHYREAGLVPLTEAVSCGIPDNDTPEKVFIEAENNRQLIEAVKALGAPDSEIIVRKYYLGQPSGQIANELGMSVSNVDTRTHRAIKRLKKSMEGESE